MERTSNCWGLLLLLFLLLIKVGLLLFFVVFVVFVVFVIFVAFFFFCSHPHFLFLSFPPFLKKNRCLSLNEVDKVRIRVKCKGRDGDFLFFYN